MVIRVRERSGVADAVSAAGSGVGAAPAVAAGPVSISSAGAAAGGAGAGVEAHAATSSSGRMPAFLITQPDSQDVDAGFVQPAAEPVEFVEIVDRADSYPVVNTVVYCNALDL